MNIYRVVLFGHKDFCPTKEFEEKLCSLLSGLIENEEYLDIYIGRNGEFDVFAASCVKRIQKESVANNCSLILVLPYAVKDIEYYAQYYDDIIIPECVNGVHPKAAITRRNEWMLDLSDLLICCVQRNNGGAYRAMEYAKKIGIEIFNVGK